MQEQSVSDSGVGERPPLALCEVLEEEYVRLHGELPYTPGWWFEESHLEDPAKLIEELQKVENVLSRHLRKRLSHATQQELSTCDPSDRRAVAALLNKLLAPPCLYDDAGFAGVSLSKETRRLAKLDLKGDDAVRVNRLLLEEAFPTCLRKIYDIRLSAIYRLIHAHKPGRAALCLSGGGIRSATFGLGVLQGLAHYNLLDKFDYLSTVSGGGYIGSWLSAWVHRDHRGLNGVIHDLRSPTASKPEPEPEQIRHLRTYSNYLTPKLGILSADTWTLVATYLRNLLLHWSVLLPLLAAVLMLPRFAVAVVRAEAGHGLLTASLAAGFVSAAAALAYMGLSRPSLDRAVPNDRDGRWRFLRSLGQGSFLVGCLAPLVVSAVSLTTYWGWLTNRGPAGAPLVAVPFGATLDGPLPFVAFGLALHLSAWTICALVDWWVWGRSRHRELVAVVVTGAAGGLLAWGLSTGVLPKLSWYGGVYVYFAAPLFLVFFLVAATLFVGLSGNFTEEEDREWWARSGAWVLIAIVTWTVVSVLVVFGPAWVLALRDRMPYLVEALGGLSGIATILLGFSSRTFARRRPVEETGRQALWLNAALAVSAPLFAAFLVVILSLGTSWLLSASCPALVRPADACTSWLDAAIGHWESILAAPLRAIAWLFVAMLGLSVVFASFVNINKFSLHAMYRNRLVRAYLGASHEKRNPDRFTGFDPGDDVGMSDLQSQKPLHVVNIALNLVSSGNLAWQQRKAEPFTVTPLHCGSRRVGYRRSKDYAKGRARKTGAAGETKERPLALGTAMAISGAAASPNMGYHSSPAVTFLMTLFNARLGWWLGNPGVFGDKTFGKTHPRFAIRPLLAEAFGLTNDENRYVYLSDGGHFDNLGLFEMVLRRCRYILISDAGRDPDCAFEDLGNAIRKVRVDLGVPITLEQILIYPRKSGNEQSASGTLEKAGKYCAIGTIGYSQVDGKEGGTDGVLLYIKPAICGNEPADVRSYAQANRLFPHEPTSDQWFSESQFESYRMLGLHTVEQVCGTVRKQATIEDLRLKMERYLGQQLPVRQWFSEPQFEIYRL